MTNWAPGMRALCVDDAGFKGYGDEAVPRRGLVYTVRDVLPHEADDLRLRLEEVVNPVRQYWHPVTGYMLTEPTLKASRFRPLLGDEQDELDAMEEELASLEAQPVEA